MHMLVIVPIPGCWCLAYARLVGYDAELNLVTDIIEEVEVEGGSATSCACARGHRWSDGAPFTSEDFRYWWEDVARQQAAQPRSRPPVELMSASTMSGRGSRSSTSAPCRYAWSKPNPVLLPRARGRQARCLTMPRRTTEEQFHERYADPTSSRAWSRRPGARLGASCTVGASACSARQPGPAGRQPWGLAERAATSRFVSERTILHPPGR